MGRRPLVASHKEFWAMVKQSDDKDACWPWQGPADHVGFGRLIMLDKQLMRPHRHAFRISRQVNIPKNLHVRHVCDNPICCNPYHLDLCAAQPAKGQGPGYRKGEGHPHARLSEADVKMIDVLLTAGCSQTSIARTYGINQTTVHQICVGQTWSHITGRQRAYQQTKNDLIAFLLDRGKTDPAEIAHLAGCSAALVEEVITQQREDKNNNDTD